MNVQDECSKQKEMDDKLNEHGSFIKIKSKLPIDKNQEPHLFKNQVYSCYKPDNLGTMRKFLQMITGI